VLTELMTFCVVHSVEADLETVGKSADCYLPL
jgi:hypothetical protein